MRGASESSATPCKPGDSVSYKLQVQASLTTARHSSLGAAERRDSFDRFIPMRRGSDHDASYRLLTASHVQHDSDVFADTVTCTPKLRHSEACASQDKILAFSPVSSRAQPSPGWCHSSRSLGANNKAHQFLDICKNWIKNRIKNNESCIRVKSVAFQGRWMTCRSRCLA